MVSINKKIFVWAAVCSIIGVYSIISCFFHSNLWGDISKSVAISNVLLYVYSKWLWKRKYLLKLLPFPYLGGTWEGKIISTYKGSTSRDIKVKIKHELFGSYLTLYSNESKSLSKSFSFNIDKQRGIKQIIYTYQNDPNAKVRKHSEIHYGTAVLDIDDSGISLEGNYWTDRNTTGIIRLNKTK